MSERSYEKCPIAIVGMSCRLPGASDPDQLWSMLVEGRDALRPLEERWKATLIHGRRQDLKPPTPRAGLLDSIAAFDAAFFGISPREAARMDPQQRILLELVWEAFEDAGIPPVHCAGKRVGVFAAYSIIDYWSLMTDSALRSSVDAWTNLGGSSAILSNRVSHAFDFRGPSVTVDSACSASLYAIHLAKESLRRGECTLAVVGGINILARPETTLGFAQAHMLSPTGRCRPFAENVDGYVRGEGGGVVLLEAASDAERAGRRVYARIRGSAVSQDGHSPGITVPTVAGQAEMLRLAYADANLSPTQVRYLEAHATGTPLGDPIEVEAIGQVIGKARDGAAPCVIGSIKASIGHLEGGAGMAGLVKASLCLHRDRIVPSLHSRPLNPSIPFGALGVRVADRVEPFRVADAPAIAGVSSFGFGGTNVHVVLEGLPVADTAETPTSSRRPFLVPLSAKRDAAVRALASSTASALRKDMSLTVRDVAYTLGLRRASHGQRAFVVASDREQLLAALDRVSDASTPIDAAAGEPARLVFVFTGMGPQWAGMARTLLRDEPIFRESLERTDRAFLRLSGWSILERAFLPPQESVPSLVDEADLGHPAHFAVQMALCDLLEAWGIQPAAIVGHSAGEVSAACRSGVLSFEDSLRVLYHRSRLVQRIAGQGRMLATNLSAEEARTFAAEFSGELHLAAINSPVSVTFSGQVDVLGEALQRLEADGRFARWVPGCFPYHSPAFEPIRDELVHSLEGLAPRPGHTRLVSTVSGTWAQKGEFGAEHWWANVRGEVRFSDAIDTLMQDGHSIFVEIGAHPSLGRSVSEARTAGAGDARCLSSLRRELDDRDALLTLVGKLWALGHCGYPTDVAGNLIRLPFYPWQHESYWIEPPADLQVEGTHAIRGDRVAADRPTWQARVSASNPAWASEHRIAGQILLPAAAMLEAWGAASLDAGASLPIAFKDVRLSEMRALMETPVHLRVRRIGQRWTLESATQIGAGEWSLHASATIDSASVTPAVDLESERRRLLPSKLDYEGSTRLGYDYGPAFQSVVELWKGDSRALGRVALRGEVADRDIYLVHPIQLDGALHTILAAAPYLDGTYVPVAFERLAFLGAHRPAAERDLWAVASVSDQQADHLIGSVVLCDPEGRPLLAAAGVRFERIGRSALLQRGCVTHERWVRTTSRSLERHRDPGAALSFEELPAESTVQSRAAVNSSLDHLAAAHLSSVLERRAVQESRSASADRDEMSELVEWLLTLRALGPSEITDPETSSRDVTRGFPSHHLERELLSRTAAPLCDPALDREHLNEALFHPSHGVATLFFANSETFRPSNQLIRSVLKREIASLKACRHIRILEIGAGTGGQTSWILPTLEPGLCEYLFTDPHESFVVEAAQRYREIPLVATAVFDPAKDPEAQGLELGSFDVVISSSEIGTNPALQPNASALRRLLRPAGLLLTVGCGAPSLWLDLVLGLLNWLRRADRPTLSPHVAGDLALDGRGFIASRTLSAASSPLRVTALRADQQVFFRDAAARPHEYAFTLLQSSALGVELASRLAELGSICDFADTLAGGTGAFSGRSVDFFLYVAEPGRTVDQELSRFLEAVRYLGDRPEVHLVVTTRGAHQTPGQRAPRDPAQAALWGFARVLRNEGKDWDVKLIDVDPEAPLDVNAWLVELEGDPSSDGDQEDEIALRGSARFVPRMMPFVEDPEVSLHPASSHAWRARVDHPGDLRSIVARSVERSAPRAGEIELEVHFVGLNFRDVLLALDALNDVRASGAGLPIGSDCAGRVVRVGSSVERLSPGDWVVGVANGCLGSHVTVEASLFTRLPEGMTPAEAVTLPIVGATIEMALRDAARLGPGDTILIHSAAGGVGLAALGFCRQVGARVLATAGTEEKRQWLLSLGAHAVMDSRSLDFHSDVLRLTEGRGVDIVLNSLSGQALERSLDLLAPGGRFVELGKRDIFADRTLALRPLARNASFHVVDFQWLVMNAPERAGALIERAFAAVNRGELRPVPHQQFPFDRVQDALRIMAAGRHTGKIVISTADHVGPTRGARSARLPIRGDSSYLITGGLGGFGLATARWLAKHGARHLVLVGRKGAATPEARQGLEDLESAGVHTEVIQADVSSPDDVARMLARARSSMPTLRGIFHAAMALEDAAIHNMSHAGLLDSLAAKAQGAWNLHEQSTDEPLDLFVLFSSISRVLANPGQASYVAANEFMAALASIRRSQDLPATCIDWGVIEDVGYLTRNPAVLEKLRADGATPLLSSDALDALGQTLLAGGHCFSIAAVDWKKVASRLPRVASSARFSTIRDRQGGADEAASASDDLPGLEGLTHASAAARLEISCSFVRSRAALILRCTSEMLTLEPPLREFGFDSLMELELRALLQKGSGLPGGVLDVGRESSLRSLSEALLRGLGFHATESAVLDPFGAWVDERQRALDAAFEAGAPSEVVRALISTAHGLSARVQDLDAEGHRSHRASFAKLRPYFLRSALLSRAYHKPLGYPGDYDMMKRIYRNVPEGAGIDATVDRMALALPACQASRNRVAIVSRHLRWSLKPDRRARIASVGCGPAWELRAYLEENPDHAARMDVLLVDQDASAVADCVDALSPHVARGLKLDSLVVSVEELLAPGSIAATHLSHRDLIYSVGLFDYFETDAVRRHLQDLYGQLEPGSRLLIGNLSTENPDRWLMEYVTDWMLFYRSAADLERAAVALQPAPGTVAVEAESLGINLFLAVTRTEVGKREV